MQRIRGSTRMRYINLLLLTYLLIGAFVAADVFFGAPTAPNNTRYNDYVMRPRSYSMGLRNTTNLC